MCVIAPGQTSIKTVSYYWNTPVFEAYKSIREHIQSDNPVEPPIPCHPFYSNRPFPLPSWPLFSNQYRALHGQHVMAKSDCCPLLPSIIQCIDWSVQYRQQGRRHSPIRLLLTYNQSHGPFFPYFIVRVSVTLYIYVLIFFSRNETRGLAHRPIVDWRHKTAV